MPQKASSWYIAATHYLTTALIGGILSRIIMIGIFVLLPELHSAIESLALLVVSTFSVGLAVWYSSAKVLKKKYTVKEKDRIIKLSTIYFIVLGLLALILYIFKGAFSTSSEVEIITFIFRTINLIVLLVVFRWGSKKFIKVEVDKNREV
ncbi:hypothetical protein AKJ56_02265 [candidate division MSBL1 archaeon SCGC-AAA382N08]|uniref:Uncharacterized protein n=1 Tax=candidate division MSBL1 archaeon SCGC-AAA382N08 TaxID=1698285 RepID=A0A133VN32_9EURY|nr:hypothetical protein AKJ56_02265 [candidate division MSBL1 archaeon SCGC-AAA382N08]